MVKFEEAHLNMGLIYFLDSLFNPQVTTRTVSIHFIDAYTMKLKYNKGLLATKKLSNRNRYI